MILKKELTTWLKDRGFYLQHFKNDEAFLSKEYEVWYYKSFQTKKGFTHYIRVQIWDDRALFDKIYVFDATQWVTEAFPINLITFKDYKIDESMGGDIIRVTEKCEIVNYTYAKINT